MYGHRFINIETEEEDNMADNQFASTIGALFQGMDEFVTTKTVVGEPVTVGDAIILPLVDVTCGMAAGAFGQSAKEKNAGGMSAKPYCPCPPDCFLYLPCASTFLRSVSRNANFGLLSTMSTLYLACSLLTTTSSCCSPMP